MTNIERAIERLEERAIIRYRPNYSSTPYYAVNLNDCRAEIVALMRGVSYGGGCTLCQAYEDEISERGHGPECELAALAAKILEGEKL